MVKRLSRTAIQTRRTKYRTGLKIKGRPFHVPTDKQREDVVALAQVGYDQNRIAAYIGITGTTLRRAYRAELDFAAMDLLKLARKGLKHGLDNNEQWAVQFTLRTKGKNYGWLERHEITGKDGKPLVDLSRLNEKQLSDLAKLVEAAETNPEPKDE
jgi:hypothetical protein